MQRLPWKNAYNPSIMLKSGKQADMVQSIKGPPYIGDGPELPRVGFALWTRYSTGRVTADRHEPLRTLETGPATARYGREPLVGVATGPGASIQVPQSTGTVTHRGVTK